MLEGVFFSSELSVLNVVNSKIIKTKDYLFVFLRRENRVRVLRFGSQIMVSPALFGFLDL